MATAGEKLTFVQFQSLYGPSDHAYEYWYGEAKPKGMPTWVHGLLQKIIMALLDDAGLVSGSAIELQIDSEARPRPDVIATSGRLELPYPTSGVDVVVEIRSEDDSMPHMRSKCRAYKNWGFFHVYVVDCSHRTVVEWVDGSFIVRDNIVSVPAARIWSALDLELSR